METIRISIELSTTRVLELAETEFMVRATGYLKTLNDFRAIPLRLDGGVPVTLGDVAHIQLGPEMRRGFKGRLKCATTTEPVAN